LMCKRWLCKKNYSRRESG